MSVFMRHSVRNPGSIGSPRIPPAFGSPFEQDDIHHKLRRPTPVPGAFLLKPDPIKKPLKVAIFEDQQMVLDGYIKEFGKDNGIAICTSRAISSQAEAVSVCRREKPDIVITDLCLTSDHQQGFAILAKIREILPEAIVALSTMNYDPVAGDVWTERILKSGFNYVIQKGDIIAFHAMLKAEVCKGSG